MACERAATTGRRLSGALVEECVRAVSPRTDAALSDGPTTSSCGAAAPYGLCEEDAQGSATGADDTCAHAKSVFLTSASQEWYTPAHIIELVREVFSPGIIDLDPCSSSAANGRIGARVYYDAAVDGLNEANEWNGNVFINPPFGTLGGESMQGLFFSRCLREYKAGNVKQAVLLLKSAVGYDWFRGVLQWPVCFVGERLAFVRPEIAPRDSGNGMQWGTGRQNPHGSVVVYMGPEAAKFAEHFSAIGSVPGFNAWALPCDKPST